MKRKENPAKMEDPSSSGNEYKITYYNRPANKEPRREREYRDREYRDREYRDRDRDRERERERERAWLRERERDRDYPYSGSVLQVVNVFQGKFQDGSERGMDVMVKRIPKTELQEGEIKLKELDHPNIIKLIDWEDQGEFRCFALEYCVGSLDQMFSDEYREQRQHYVPMPKEIEALRQLAAGLEYIHSKGLVYRCVKPSNVLVSTKNDAVVMKWADFGLKKETKPERKHHHMMGGFKDDSMKWKAPEVLQLLNDPNIYVKEDGYLYAKTAEGNEVQVYENQYSDVFAAGLMFFTILTRGKHLYGSGPQVASNIHLNMKLNDNHMQRKHWGSEIIKKMCHRDPEKRWKMPMVSEQLLKKYKDKMKSDFVELCQTFTGTPSDIRRVNEYKKEEYFDINEPDFDSYTVIIYLGRKKVDNLELVLQHLFKEFDLVLDYQDEHGLNTLHYVCQNNYKYENQKEIIQLLIEKGVPVNQLENHFNWNALHIVFQHYQKENLLDIVKILVDAGININHTSRGGFNPFHYLCRRYPHENITEIINYLLEKGVIVNGKTNEGETPIQFLKESYEKPNLQEIMDLLVKHGAEIPEDPPAKPKKPYDDSDDSDDD